MMMKMDVDNVQFALFRNRYRIGLNQLRQCLVLHGDASSHYNGQQLCTAVIGSAAAKKHKRMPSPILFKKIDQDGEAVAHFKVGSGADKHCIQLVAKPPPTGRPDRPCNLPRTVNRELFRERIIYVKGILQAAARSVVAELRTRFPHHDLLDALGIVHPRFFLKGDFGEFQERVEVLCNRYGVSKRNSKYELVPALIARNKLRSSAPFFFTHAQPLAQQVLAGDKSGQWGAVAADSGGEDSDENASLDVLGDDDEEGEPVDVKGEEEEEEEGGGDSQSEDKEDSAVCQVQEERRHRGKVTTQEQKDAAKVTPMQLFWEYLMAAKEDAANRIGEFKKIAEIMIVMAGSIEDERLFSAVSFVFSKHRCSLRESLEKCVRLMTQDMLSMDTFPWDKAIQQWHDGACKRGRYVLPAL